MKILALSICLLTMSNSFAAPAPAKMPPPNAPKPSKEVLDTLQKEEFTRRAFTITVSPKEVKANQEFEVTIRPKEKAEVQVTAERISVVLADGPTLLASADATLSNARKKEWRAKLKAPAQSPSGKPQLIVTIFSPGKDPMPLIGGLYFDAPSFGPIKIAERSEAVEPDTLDAQEIFDTKNKSRQIQVTLRFGDKKEKLKQAVLYFFDGNQALNSREMTCSEKERTYICLGLSDWPSSAAPKDPSLRVILLSSKERYLEKILKAKMK